LAFGFNIDVLAFPPQRGVHNFRKDQERSEGIEEIVLIKAVKGGGTSHIDIR
jgi:hypothetical protein